MELIIAVLSFVLVIYFLKDITKSKRITELESEVKDLLANDIALVEKLTELGVTDEEIKKVRKVFVSECKKRVDSSTEIGFPEDD